MIMTALRNMLIVVTVLTILAPAYAQKKNKSKPKAKEPVIDTNQVVHDIYTGVLMGENGDTIAMLLQLHHKLYHSEGSIDIDETYKKTGGRSLLFKTTGTWFNAQDYPEDVDATVVHIEADEKSMFFLHREDGNLQKLDATLKIIEPEDQYIFALKHPANEPKRKDTVTEAERTMRRLAGTYKGKLPCADCSAISSTLVLKFGKGHAKAGDYVLTDKYIGGSHGDITNEKKGKWSYVSRRIEADRKSTIIVLDSDKRGRETYYFIKKDGNIIQVDRGMKRIESPVDQTLKRQ